MHLVSKFARRTTGRIIKNPLYLYVWPCLSLRTVVLFFFFFYCC